MVEKPTLYQWLLKIAIILVFIAIGYIAVMVDKIFPSFKDTITFRYIIKPVLYLVGIALIILFIT